MSELSRVQLHERNRLPGCRLGRHIHHDARSRLFPAERAPKIVSVRHTAVGLPLNQGDVESCTANALIGALNSIPNYRGGPVLAEGDALTLYKRETEMEGKPYPEYDPGGTGLMVCKAAKELGLISSYHHAFGIQHALEALVIRPVITGIGWWSSFDQPDEDGVISIADDAELEGGHEICLDEIDEPKQLVWFWQSWGQWGKDGRGAMTFATWARLLADYGDVTVPIV